MGLIPTAFVALCLMGVIVAAGQTPAAPPATPGRAGGAPPQAPPDQTVVGRMPEGFTLRLAKKTNHISNYNESVIPAYTLPDPLVMFDGRPVKTAADWRPRRAEILRTHVDRQRVEGVSHVHGSVLQELTESRRGRRTALTFPLRPPPQ